MSEETPPTMRQRFEDVAEHLGHAIALAFIAIVILGYYFPHHNHAQTALPLLHVIDPELMTRDEVSLSLAQSGPRYYYLRLVAALSRFDLHTMHQGFFALYALSSTAMAGACLAIARVLTPKPSGRWGALFLACLVVMRSAKAVGMNDFYWSTMTPSFLAGALTLWAYYFALRERYLGVYIMLGLGSFFQLIVTSLGGGLLTPWLALCALRHKRLRAFAAGVLIWIACTSAVALPTILNNAGAHETFGYDVIDTFGYIRAPHHWVPSLWPTEAWYQYAGLVTFILAAAWVARQRAPQLAGLNVSVVLFACGALALNYVVVEVYPVAGLAKLQLARVVPFVQMMAVLSAVVMAAWSVERRRFVLAFLLIAALPMAKAGVFLVPCALALLVVGDAARDDAIPAWREVLYVLALAAGAVVIAEALTYGAFDRSLGRVFSTALLGAALIETAGLTGRAPRLTRAVVIVALVAGVSLYVPDKNRTVRLNKFPSNDLLKVARVMRDRSPKDALFLAPINGISGVDAYFSLVAHRAVAVHFKNIPFTDGHIFEWRRRLELIFGRKLSRSNRRIGSFWRRASFETILNACRELSVDFLVIESSRIPSRYRKVKPFYRSRSYTVLKVAELPRQPTAPPTAAPSKPKR